MYKAPLGNLLLALTLLNSCRLAAPKAGVKDAVTAGLVRNISRSLPTGALRGFAFNNLRPLARGPGRNSYSTLVKLDARHGVTSARELGVGVRAGDLAIGSLAAASIAMDPVHNLAVISFDQDVFSSEPGPKWNASRLAAGTPVTRLGYGPSVNPVDGAAALSGARPVNIEVSSVTVDSFVPPAGEEARFDGHTLATAGVNLTRAEADAVVSDANLSGSDLSRPAGRSAGGPLVALVDGQPVIAGIVTESSESDKTGQNPTVYAVDTAQAPVREWLKGLAAIVYGAPDDEIAKHIQAWPELDRLDIRQVRLGLEGEFTAPSGVLSDAKLFTFMSDFNAKVKELAMADPSVQVTEKIEANFRTSIAVTKLDQSASIKMFPYLDPGVLEIPLDPMTLEELRNAKELLRTYYYGATKALGLVPGTKEINRWSQQTNLSWKQMMDQADLFKRFVVDYLNHPELALGALGGDIRNAPPFAVYNQELQNAMKQLVASSPTSELNDPGSSADFALKVSSLYQDSPAWKHETVVKRYQAINFSALFETSPNYKGYAVESTKRIEMRAFYMQPTVEHLISSAEVIVGRLLYSAIDRSPIIYNPTPVRPYGEFQTEGVQPSMTADEVGKAYVKFLTQTGLDVDRHLDFMPNTDVQAAARYYYTSLANARDSTSSSDRRDDASPHDDRGGNDANQDRSKDDKRGGR